MKKPDTAFYSNGNVCLGPIFATMQAVTFDTMPDWGGVVLTDDLN